ncbi:MAG: DNA mismatch repair endonuclease MutL [Anaerolineae bacterium]
MPIKLLPEEIASRIAAGEVVERPASVVKELVENSLDAGATRVDIEIRDGGAKLIRVRDNGVGMLADEVALAFRRHATSKLDTAADLEHIATLGFRGEALSSIAAVSRTTCITRHASETTGTRIRLEGGEVVTQSHVGRPPGTEIVIEDLFYNVPARQKFMRTERTERRHIDAFVTRYAIAYPEVAFTVVHDDREVLSTPGNGAARSVLIDVYGTDLGTSLLAVPEELTAQGPIQVHGFVGPTTVHRANRGYITLFINGRWIEDLRLSYAVIQAYHTLLPVKRYPVAFVLVEMPPEDVDVNVHPAKSEVRFRDPDSVFRAVQRTVRVTVVSEAPAAATWSGQSADAGASSAQSTRARLASLRPSQEHIRFDRDVDDSARTPGDLGYGRDASEAVTVPAQGQSAASARANLPPLRIIGQLATMFIITEGPDGLYLIDQHAAHERVLYEQMLSEATRGQIAVQPLLEAKVVTLPTEDADRLAEMLPVIHELGIEAEAFGPNTYLVRSVPALLKHVAPDDLLADIAAAQEGRSPVQEGLEEAIVRHICKRAAVKAGQVLSSQEMERLIKDLERTDNPRTCPHGRPTIVQISTEELAREFGRGQV